MAYKHAEYCYENNDHEGESLMIFTTRIDMCMLFNLCNLALLKFDLLWKSLCSTQFCY